MTEELKQKAEEYTINAICEACNQCQSKGYIGCDKYRVGKEAYIAGATENGIQWHDLLKNPNDLPKESCSVLVTYNYDDRTYTDNYINNKEKNIIGWESEYEDPYCSPRVIAWAEKPQFKE